MVTLLTEMLTLVCWSRISEAEADTRHQAITSPGARPSKGTLHDITHYTLQYRHSEPHHYTLLNLILISCFSNQECFCDDATFLKYHSNIKMANCLYIQSVCVARTVIDSVP